jgi:hypothetical protein
MPNLPTAIGTPTVRDVGGDICCVFSLLENDKCRKRRFVANKRARLFFTLPDEPMGC